MGNRDLKPTASGILCVLGTAALVVVAYVFVLYTWPAMKHARSTRSDGERLTERYETDYQAHQ